MHENLRKYVGSPRTNRKFHDLTVDFLKSERLEALESKFVNLEQKLGQLEATENSLQNRINEVSCEVKNLSTII